MPEIGPDSIPGSVNIPTWVLIVAIIALFTIRELERRTWFKKVGQLTAALRKNNDLIDAFMKREEPVP